MHFAGLKAVGESVAQPLRYYSVNVGGAASLLQAMDDADVRRLVFSSSCTVYGDPERVPSTSDPPPGHQPLRPHQADGRGHARRPGRQRRSLAPAGVALLQPGRCPRQRPPGRGSRRHPQQPDALRHAGGHRPPPVRTGVRRRLSHARRHGRTRLPPRGRPGARTSRRAGRPASCRDSRPSTWAPGRGRRCSTSSPPPRGPWATTCPTRWSSGGRATSPPRGPTRPWPTTCWAGGPSAPSTTWPPTTGAGSLRTPGLPGPRATSAAHDPSRRPAPGSWHAGPVRLVLVGPPGSGKGTQVPSSPPTSGCPTCRRATCSAEVAAGTELGRRVAALIDRGDLVPDDLMVDVVAAALDQRGAAAHRRLRARRVPPHGGPGPDPRGGRLAARRPPTWRCYLAIPDGVVRQRLARPGAEEGRRDDADPDVIDRRLEVYRDETEPLLDHYLARGALVTVDGDGHRPTDVSARLLAAVTAAADPQRPRRAPAGATGDEVRRRERASRPSGRGRTPWPRAWRGRRGPGSPRAPRCAPARSRRR